MSCSITCATLLFAGQNVPSKSLLLSHPLWSPAPQPSQELWLDPKLHQTCKQLVLNHPKSHFLWSWIFWQNCTVPAFQVNVHKVAVVSYLLKKLLASFSFFVRHDWIQMNEIKRDYLQKRFCNKLILARFYILQKTLCQIFFWSSFSWCSCWRLSPLILRIKSRKVCLLKIQVCG